LIVCSIVYLNDLKIAAGDQPAPMATSRGLTVGFMSASFGTKIFVQEREGQPCAFAIVFSAWLSARRRATYSNPNKNTYLGCVLGFKSSRVRLLAA
jgi:hypothetical protein